MLYIPAILTDFPNFMPLHLFVLPALAIFVFILTGNKNMLRKLTGLIGLCCFFFYLNVQSQETIVLISTNQGNMKVRLYNDMPLHRDFFLSQIRKGYFDGTLFSRVIPGFVIQGGSEDSKGAPPGTLVGHGRSSMLLPPEFRIHHFPKKGALGMPRQPDPINPEKKSDASQFFIVQGRIYSEKELKAMEYQKNRTAKKKAMARFYTPYEHIFDSLKRTDPREYNRRVVILNEKIDSVIRAYPGHLLFLPEEKAAYTKTGGSPHLRNDYTIFGEVIEGLDVIDRIASLEADRHNRPLEDVVMKIKILEGGK